MSLSYEILSKALIVRYFNSHAGVFLRNPISRSAAWYFVIILKFILTPIFESKIHVEKFLDTKKFHFLSPIIIIFERQLSSKRKNYFYENLNQQNSYDEISNPASVEVKNICNNRELRFELLKFELILLFCRDVFN